MSTSLERTPLLLLLVVLSALTLAAGSASNSTLDVDSYINDIPERYDETQLWRIYNITEAMRQSIPVGQMMEHKFGGNIWKENSKFLDISIAKEQVKAARSFLEAHRLEPQVLNENVQSMIDEEQLDGVLATQPEEGARTSKYDKRERGRELY